MTITRGRGSLAFEAVRELKGYRDDMSPAVEQGKCHYGKNFARLEKSTPREGNDAGAVPWTTPRRESLFLQTEECYFRLMPHSLILLSSVL